MEDYLIPTTLGSLLATAHSAVMKDLVAVIEQIAPSDLSVLIIGESGTGKEWTARAIHQLSPRANCTFLPVNCGAIPPDNVAKMILGSEENTQLGKVIRPGAIDEAEGGTIFLEEIGVLPFTVQKQVARAIRTQRFRRVGGQEMHRCNVRVIAALSRKLTGRDKEDPIPEEFRQSISPIKVNLPPLRERYQDIPYLIASFLLQLNRHHDRAAITLSPDALQRCLEYDWPGNVRQLKNAVEYASAICEDHVIRVEHLPSYVRVSKSGGTSNAYQTKRLLLSDDRARENGGGSVAGLSDKRRLGE